MRKLVVRAAVAIVLIGVTDYCLWDHAPGCGVAVVALAAVVAVSAVFERRDGPAVAGGAVAEAFARE